jgi:TonB family protein
MIRFLFVLFLSVNFVFGQAVYQSHEVDKTAEPQGGNNYLLRFIENNVQVPFQARLKNITGRVFVSGVIETDGTMSDLKVVRNLHPLCDKEALRIMGLYKAWTPAQKDGKAVRQVLTFPVLIPEMPVLNYDSDSHGSIQYYDKDFKLTTDPTLYAHRYMVPLDSDGFLSGDILLTNLKKSKTEVVAPFESKKAMYYVYTDGAVADSVEAIIQTGISKDGQHYAPITTKKADGTLLSTVMVNNNERISAKYYFVNGGLESQTELQDDKEIETVWYQNGQIKLVRATEKQIPLVTPKSYMLDFWEINGRQLVKNSNGWLVRNLKSEPQKTYTEQGQLTDGLKTGKWTGKWADSTLFYEERYENGTIKEAFALYDGQKVAYTEVQKQPEFEGGIAALMTFLGETMKYPRRASRMNISGKVYLTFVITSKGEVADVTLVKGFDADCDEEAIRVVKKMTGLWKPGLYRGKLVNVKYNLPISFVLE